MPNRECDRVLRDLAISHCPACAAEKPVLISSNLEPGRLYYHNLEGVCIECPSSFIWEKRVGLQLGADIG